MAASGLLPQVRGTTPRVGRIAAADPLQDILNSTPLPQQTPTRQSAPWLPLTAQQRHDGNFGPARQAPLTGSSRQGSARPCRFRSSRATDAGVPVWPRARSRVGADTTV